MTVPRVLVIDDDVRFAAATCRWLTQLGCAADMVESPVVGLARIEAGTPLDLLLLDLHMPEIDGHTVIQRLHASGSGLPVIVISGTIDMNDIVRAWRQNAADFLRKPFRIDDLRLALERTLGHRPPTLVPRASLKARLFGAESSLAHRVVEQTLLAPLETGSKPVQIGRYRLLKLTGRGGAGEVYVAFDDELGRKVALKLLRHRDADSGHAIRREARALAQLSHPNVVQVHEVGEWQDHRFIAMEFVDGQTLDAWLAADRSSQEIWRAVVGAGRGLAAAHERGVVHGDFKPTNVMVGANGRAKVIDFGLARNADESTGAEIGFPSGTPAYMAPERATGQPPTFYSDQYSFCLVANRALTASDHTSRVIERGLANDPKGRWPTMHALLAELDRWQPRL